jgi:hypothetical protein
MHGHAAFIPRSPISCVGAVGSPHGMASFPKGNGALSSQVKNLKPLTGVLL